MGLECDFLSPLFLFPPVHTYGNSALFFALSACAACHSSAVPFFDLRVLSSRITLWGRPRGIFFCLSRLDVDLILGILYSGFFSPLVRVSYPPKESQLFVPALVPCMKGRVFFLITSFRPGPCPFLFVLCGRPYSNLRCWPDCVGPFFFYWEDRQGLL